MPSSFRIATWNVEYAYPKRLDALRAILAQHDADVWVLTETRDELRPSPEHDGMHATPRAGKWSGIRPDSRWVSIWSRYPIIKPVPTADPNRTVAVLLDTGDARKLLVYGTVLPWKGDGDVFDWSEHHRVIPHQCAEWAQLQRDYSSAALCVAGDYNTDMGTGAYYGTKAGIAALHTGLAACNLTCVTAPERLRSGLLPYPPVDHIALPRAWEDSSTVIAAWPADKEHLSDHSGLLVAIGEPIAEPPPTKDQIVARAAAAAFGKPLVTNVHRAMLVEVIVAAALGPDWEWCSADYASCDFRHTSAARLEVKQSAALQTWNATSGRVSKPTFDIAPRTGEYVDGVEWRAGIGRNADLYVFAFHPDASSGADHRDPMQWRFHVVLASDLPAQKTIGLAGIAALGPAVPFDQLRRHTDEARTRLALRA